MWHGTAVSLSTLSKTVQAEVRLADSHVEAPQLDVQFVLSFFKFVFVVTMFIMFKKQAFMVCFDSVLNRK